MTASRQRPSSGRPGTARQRPGTARKRPGTVSQGPSTASGDRPASDDMTRPTTDSGTLNIILFSS